MEYPARLSPDKKDGGFVVTFRDIPEANTQGETQEEALSMAADALLTAMDFYFEDRRRIPEPSPPSKGEHLIALPTSVFAKVLLLNEMIAKDVRPIDLAAKLGTTKQEVNRLLDLHHTTKIDRVAEALVALGKYLFVSLHEKDDGTPTFRQYEIDERGASKRNKAIGIVPKSPDEILMPDRTGELALVPPGGGKARSARAEADKLKKTSRKRP